MDVSAAQGWAIIIGAMFLGAGQLVQIVMAQRNRADIAEVKTIAVATHSEVNSKMALLLKTTGEAEKAKGVLEGAEQKEPKP